MPAPERFPAKLTVSQPANPGSQLEECVAHFEPSGTLNSVASRENFLRHSVRRWFARDGLQVPTGASEVFGRHEAILQTLVRLHRVSCNLVPEARRVPLHEYDVFTAIVLLNRITVHLQQSLAMVVGYCESTAVGEQDLRFNQLDPLQLRHLLTFHGPLAPEKLAALGLPALVAACEKNDKLAVQQWFEAANRLRDRQPKELPQILREQLSALWQSGHTGIFEVFANELAVLDAGLLSEMGWDNSRVFFALMKRFHASDCRPAAEYINADEIALAIDQRRQLGEADAVVHFRALSTTFDPQKLRRLELAVLAAPGENGTRIKTVPAISAVARKRAVAVPPPYASSEYYAQKAFRPVTRIPAVLAPN